MLKQNCPMPRTVALLAGALMGVAGTAAAEESEEIIEEIIVTAKYQRSLQDGASQKRGADNQIEAIGMEDIGVLPAKSIAEAISALPGVAGARDDDGTISQLSVRGTTDLTLGTLNGREQVTVASTRNVEYALYPPNVMTGVQVYKTARADIAEGGLSGVINMNTIRPMSFDEREIVLTGEMTFAAVSDDVFEAGDSGGQGSVVYIDQLSDNLGVVLSYAFADEVLGRDGDVNPFDWRGFAGGGFGAPPPDVDGDGVSGDEVIPAGFTLFNGGGAEERNSAFVALQWLSDEAEVNFDLLDSHRVQDKRVNGVNFIGTTNRGWALMNPVFNSRAGVDEVVSGTISVPGTNASGFGSGGSSSYNQLHEVHHDVLSTGLNVKLYRGDWTVAGDVSHSSAESDFHLFNTTTHLAPTGGFGGPTFTITFNALGNSPTLSVAENLQDPTIWVPRQFEEYRDTSSDELTTFKLDVERELSSGGPGLTSLEFGARFTAREKVFALLADRFNAAIVPDVDPVLLTPRPLDQSFVQFIATPENGPAFIVWDLFKIRDERFTSRTPQAEAMNPVQSRNTLLQQSGSVDEQTVSGYVQLNFEGLAGGRPFSGNVGVRMANTDSESPGWTTPDRVNVPATAINPSHSYSEVLPSLNLAFEVSDTSLLRLGLAKVMSRPPLDDLKSSQTLFISGFGANGTAGNPMLNPTAALQAAISYEWYPSDFTSVALAWHHSDLESFVGTEFTTIVVVTADSVDGFGNVVPGGPVNVELETLGNGDGGYIRGMEFAVTTNFGFVSETLDSLGMSVNYAFTSSDVVPVGRPELGGSVGTEGAALTGLSENVANVSFWWANYNIEARIGMDYRSEYIEPNVFGNFLNVDDTTLVSFSVSYDVSERFRVSAFGYNVGDEQRRKYTGGIPERTEFNQYYRETYGVKVFYRM